MIFYGGIDGHAVAGIGALQDRGRLVAVGSVAIIHLVNNSAVITAKRINYKISYKCELKLLDLFVKPFLQRAATIAKTTKDGGFIFVDRRMQFY